jgi:hypothetical protein
MRPFSNKLLKIVLTAAIAACVITGVVHIKLILASTVKAAAFVFNKFERLFKEKIGYFSAFVVILGLLVMLFKMVGTRIRSQRWIRVLMGYLKPVVEKFKKRKRLIAFLYGLLIIFSILLFVTAPFPYAFSFAAALTTCFLWKFKEDKNKLFIIAMVIILLYLCPYIFNGQDTHVKIFDNLDSFVAKLKVLAESGKALSLNPDTTIPNFLNGIKLNSFFSGLNVITWLFIIFGPFTGYVLNLFIMALVAFFGMALLLKHHIIENNEYSWVIIGAALSFSLLTFFPPGGLSIAGLPLLLYFFLKIRKGEGKKRYLVYIILYPFYSLMSHAGIFVIIILSVLFASDWIRTRKINRFFLSGLVLLCAVYGLTHFHLLSSLFSREFVSFREEIKIYPLGFGECLKDTVHNFIFDRTNVVSAHHVFVLIAAAGALTAGIYRKGTQMTKSLAVFIMLALANAFLWGFKYWSGIMIFREKVPFFNTFNFTRFFWLNPILWYIIFGISLLILSGLKYGKAIVSFLIIGQILFLFTIYNIEYRNRLGLKNRIHSTLTYRQFYSENLFRQIDEFIGKPKEDYRIVSLGIHPAVAQYNGFYTLDIYGTIYPLSYKHKFRRILEEELRKSKDVKRVFDDNSKRLYLLSAELHNDKRRGLTFARGITKKEGYLKIKKLELNTFALKEMGGEYIFSAVEILNFKENKLSFERTFTHSNSPWKIYLYRVL